MKEPEFLNNQSITEINHTILDLKEDYIQTQNKKKKELIEKQRQSENRRKNSPKIKKIMIVKLSLFYYLYVFV